jgi:acyl-homoserine lactone acylase PvdQ
MNKPNSFLKVASIVLLATLCVSRAQIHGETNTAALERQAKNVTIIRDNWGVPHVYGKTDADAVFGVSYAQAEDDFNRVETNFLNGMGRLAEAEGEAEIYRDLRMKLFIDPSDMKAKYASSPEWLKTLMIAWADGLNYYLYKHPQVKPRVIKQFEPWMALTFTEGSIGGDIEKVNLNQLQAFYGKSAPKQAALRSSIVEETPVYVEPTGSNGIAIAPSNTAGHHALFWINPHTSFYFRAEAQMVSDAGLNAYGAITWGQFFIYQGFNERVGWMHTTSAVDNIDEYLETIVKKGDKLYYKYGSEERPVESKKIVVPYKSGNGMAQAEFTVYRTQHGPVIRETNGKWVSIALMQEPVKALTQSYSRTKAKNYKEFRDTMELHTNSSNNTVYADADGTIAYFHSNFIPRRDVKFDWSKPVDGSDPATDWKGVLSIDETPGLKNPPNGWLYNTNNSPWSAAGPNSPKQADYPAYVDKGSENARGLHATMLLEKKKDFTLDSLIAAAFDGYQPGFKDEIPALVKAWDRAPSTNPLKTKLSEPVEMLRSWDLRWSAKSIPTSLAVYWGEEIEGRSRNVDKATDEQLLQALSTAVDKLTNDFGTWKTPWGDINRYQRLTSDIAQKYDDKAPSVSVPFTSSRWGSLASFGARAYPGTKKRYGNTGNSFLAAVEFGPQVRAKAVTAGGESGDPKSPHFGDQVERYASGNLRDVYFYRKQLDGHIERQYHPGE